MNPRDGGDLNQSFSRCVWGPAVSNTNGAECFETGLPAGHFQSGGETLCNLNAVTGISWS